MYVNGRRPSPPGSTGGAAAGVRGRGGQVGRELRELADGARRERALGALVELLDGQPPGERVVAQGPDRPLAVGVGGAQVGYVGHAGQHVSPRRSASLWADRLTYSRGFHRIEARGEPG